MYVSKKNRELIKMKYGCRCAYSGTPLKDDWQIDHLEPLVRHPFSGEPLFKDAHRLENLVPCQRIINHYKGSLDLETFRTWFLGGLHERLKKLPKNPRTEKSRRKTAYLKEVAELFGISESVPFGGMFYFEAIHPAPSRDDNGKQARAQSQSGACQTCGVPGDYADQENRCPRCWAQDSL